MASMTVDNTAVVILLNTVSLHVDYTCFNIMDFDGISRTGHVCHINTGTIPGVVGDGAATGATPLTPFQVTVCCCCNY